MKHVNYTKCSPLYYKGDTGGANPTYVSTGSGQGLCWSVSVTVCVSVALWLLGVHSGHSLSFLNRYLLSSALSPSSLCCLFVRIGETGEKRTSGARDTASATQAERCALHHTRVLYLLDGRLAILRRRRGGNLVNIHTNCIQLYLTGL